jgi:hypothetical protein
MAVQAAVVSISCSTVWAISRLAVADRLRDIRYRATDRMCRSAADSPDRRRAGLPERAPQACNRHDTVRVVGRAPKCKHMRIDTTLVGHLGGGSGRVDERSISTPSRTKLPFGSTQ